MTDLHQLIADAVEQTGAQAPRVLDADAPTLATGAGGDGGASDVYLVGLIGGKEVGKSAMVNALAGRAISAVTSHGAGTDGVVAYAHASRAAEVRALLDGVAPGQYRLVTHDAPGDPARVLLDLPDIDSHFAAHLALTRRVLRRVLFPVWVASVEKYADRQPRDMLARVAEGNDPGNFVFALNKVDQLGDDRASIDELRRDHAARVAAAVGLDAPPVVYAVSATHPDAHDLPALRAAVTRDRRSGEVSGALARAGARRERSLVAWLATQDLPARADRLAHALRDAEELVTTRVAGPLLERAVPRLLLDPAYRASLADDAMAARVARWPLVNLVHTLLAPVLSAATTIVRGSVAPRGAGTADALVTEYLSVDGRPLPDAVQAAFAHAHQTSPAVASAYVARRPWEPPGAAAATADLRAALAGAVDRQRAAVVDRIAASRNPLAAVARWALTVGALLWFPFGQPVLEAALQPSFERTTGELLLLLVQLLGTTYLLTTAAFLLVYFVVLWLALRWNTQRRVGRLLTRWSTGDGPADLDPSRAVIAWADDLLAPLASAHARAADLATRAAAAAANAS